MHLGEISKLLAGQAQAVAEHLLPNGKRDGGRWRCGDIDGNEGKSLCLQLTGPKAGLWTDYATGEGGDLITLWAARHGGSIPKALEEIKPYLGIRDDDPFVKPRKEYKRPQRPDVRKPKGEALRWLTEDRKLSEQTIGEYKISAQGNVVYFPFLRDGELVMCKRRTAGEKDIRPTSAEQEPCLFGWQAIPDDARSVVIVEGELDAPSMAQYGYPALSVPYGGGSGGKQQQWIDNEYDHMARFDTIYLAMDDDEAGESAARYIAGHLGLERCLRVKLPRKDANDCLQGGVPAMEIDKAIISATNFDPPELRSATDYTDEVIAQFYPPEDQPTGILLPWQKTHDKIELRPAELSLWAGMSGHGKSQVVGQIALEAMAQGYRVCIASMEMKPTILLKRMTRQAAAVVGSVPSIPYIREIQGWFADQLWLFDCIGTAKTDDMLRVFQYARRRYAVDLFIVDSLLKLGLGEDDYNGQKLTTERLCDFKNAHDCHIAMVVHSRKQADESRMGGKYDIRGSTSISDLCDSAFMVWRNKAKEEKQRTGAYGENEDAGEYDAEQPDCLVSCDKQRNGEWEGRFKLWFEHHTWQYTESSARRVKRYVKYQSEVADGTA